MRNSRFFAILGLSLLAPALSSQTVGGEFTQSHLWTGGNAQDMLGYTLKVAGDVNGDGFADVIAGAPGIHPGPSGYVKVFSGADGSVIYEFKESVLGNGVGRVVAGAGDVNADGFSDFIVSAAEASVAGIEGVGTVFIYSGRTGQLLFKWHGTSRHEYFGSTVSGAGDFNADGYDDVVIGSPYFSTGGLGYSGTAMIYSGLDGSLLGKWWGSSDYEYVGIAVSKAGDLNLDGYADVIISSGAINPANPDMAGLVTVYSGKDSTALFRGYGEIYSGFGHSVSDAGDVNADGHPDVIVGASRATDHGNLVVGAAYVFSGANGDLIYEWSGNSHLDNLGISVSGAGDVNGDGYGDLLIGADGVGWGSNSSAGEARLMSGRDGSLMKTWHGYEQSGHFGAVVSGGGIERSDINGDGLDDIVIGAYNEDYYGQPLHSGVIYAHSFNPFLLASATEYSQSTGGPLEFHLKFPEQLAGYQYKILASASGIGPTRWGVEIPLTFDRVAHRSWMGSYPGLHYGNTMGALDANGRAEAVIGITPGNWAETVGKTFYLAAVAMPFGHRPTQSSAVWPIEIKP